MGLKAGADFVEQTAEGKGGKHNGPENGQAQGQPIRAQHRGRKDHADEGRNGQQAMPRKGTRQSGKRMTAGWAARGRSTAAVFADRAVAMQRIMPGAELGQKRRSFAHGLGQTSDPFAFKPAPSNSNQGGFGERGNKGEKEWLVIPLMEPGGRRGRWADEGSARARGFPR